MDGKILVRNKRNASDERWITRKAFDTLRREFVIVENQGIQQTVQTQGTQIPNVPSPVNEGAVVAAEADNTEIKVKRQYNRKKVNDEA